jgi:hypothetical protein
MKKILSVLVVVIFIISGTALAKSNSSGGPDKGSQGPHSGPQGGDQDGNCDSGQGSNGNNGSGGPSHDHDTDVSDHGAPNSGDGVSDGSGW